MKKRNSRFITATASLPSSSAARRWNFRFSLSLHDIDEYCLNVMS